jgi:hypothetical protein
MRFLPNGKPFILPNGKPSHANCCCSFYCVRDPWPTLYLTLDNFEIDLPLTPALVGTGECDFFCTESELNDLAAAHFTALPSTGDLTWSVLNEAGPDVPATPSGTWDTCHKLAFGPECLLYTDGKYRYVLNNGYVSPDVSDPCSKFPAAGVLDQDMQCGGPGLPIRLTLRSSCSLQSHGRSLRAIALCPNSSGSRRVSASISSSRRWSSRRISASSSSVIGRVG